jgi:hypothetical protein
MGPTSCEESLIAILRKSFLLLRMAGENGEFALSHAVRFPDGSCEFSGLLSVCRKLPPVSTLGNNQYSAYR